MSFSEGIRSTALLAACGGDTVKLFDVNVESGDPCVLSYTPTPGSHVNSVKWNHTNLVVASAGDDKKISLWRKNGQSMGTLPLSRGDVGDVIDESISAINFSNKGSRYLCSGGSGRFVRIWDLQRKLCIKKLSGHTDTITGVMYNFKDEHLASISVKGDLILHNLASGARAAELKDPNRQVLRVLDYSRFNRHVLVTAGDDGSLHLWDTTNRNPKVSWLKQHSAPTTGLCFSPSNDKIIASVGLDKKLYTFDSANRKPAFCAPYEAPFSSLVFRDDGNILAAGTNSGRVVFYDVRGKPQPFTVLRAYNSSESVTSLCWQRSKPVFVNENNCTAEVALLGGTGEDSVLMPDPLPSLTVSNFSSTSVVGSRNSLSVSTSAPVSNASAFETPVKNNLRTRGTLARLQATRSSQNFKDDMDVFSPLVDVQPVTPSLGNWYDIQDEAKNDGPQNDKLSTFLSSSALRFPYSETNTESHAISDWLSSTASMQDGTVSTVSPPSGTSVASDSSFSVTPPDAWGGNAISEKLNGRHPVASFGIRKLPTGSVSSGSLSAAVQDISAPTSLPLSSFLANSSLGLTNIPARTSFGHDALPARTSFGHDAPSSSTESSPQLSVLNSLGLKSTAGQANLEFSVPLSSSLPRRYSTYAERMSTTSSFINGTSSVISSPKAKKTGNETREELTTMSSKQDQPGATGLGNVYTINGSTSESHGDLPRSANLQQGTSSFSLQLFQRILEEALGSMRQSIHEDVRNLHIELLRQFHMQEMEMSNLLSLVLEKQDELAKEVQVLRKENQQLRQLL